MNKVASQICWALARFCIAVFTFGQSGSTWAQATQIDIATDLTDPSNLNDFEPSIAVNPANPEQIAIVTFSENWNFGNAPVWKSDDAGATWRKVFQIPQPAALCGPGDQKIAFDSQGNLFIAELGLDCVTHAAQDFIYRQNAGPDDPLTVGASYGDDQPHVDVDKAGGSGCFARLYSPWLNFNVGNPQSTVSDSTTSGQTMTDVAAGNNLAFSDRTTRIALSSDGKAYIIYKTQEGAVDRNFENAHFYVRRSDDCGATWNANGGSASGVSVHGSVGVVTWDTQVDPSTGDLFLGFGNRSKGPVARARSSDAWVAVDPTSGDVYAAYVSKDTSGFGQIYVARSATQGMTWMAPVRVTDGTHHSAYPETAVTVNGTVGVLYVDYDDIGPSTIFRHHFSRSFDQGAHWSDETLQALDTSTFNIPVTSPPLWGDYEGLTAVGKIFYGVYTGESSGRTTTQLDPIFFRESGVPASSDFYVRDWTDNATSHDNGEEPSTNPVWWTTSDVWNRLANSPGAFNANDQPDHQNAKIGQNFAFARISRKMAAPSGSPDIQVTPTFLYADYGHGVNYQVLGSAAPVNFHAADVTPVVTSGSPWDLPATHSTHVCLAVEISSPGDPFSPDLAGRAPGPSDPLIVIDNNKAQRNMDLVLGESGGDLSFYAIVHNADLATRNITLQYVASADVLERLRGAKVGIVGSESKPFKSGDTITFAKMQPAESRWIGLTFALAGQGGGPLPVTFSEVAGNRAVNGFTISVLPSSMELVIRENLEAHRAVFLRLAAAFRIQRAHEESEAAQDLLRETQISAQHYLEFLKQHHKPIGAFVTQLLATSETRDSFGTEQALNLLEGALQSGDVARTATAHASLLNKLDGFETLLQKVGGDPADILQMVKWQLRLYSTVPQLNQLHAAAFVVDESREFIDDFGRRKRGVDAYPQLMCELLKSFRQTAEALEQINLHVEHEIDQVEDHLNSMSGLEKAHRDYLLKLQSLSK